MPNMTQSVSESHASWLMTILSRLLLAPEGGGVSARSMMTDLRSEVQQLDREEFHQLVKLADSNHVVVRGMEVVLRLMHDAKDDSRAEWARSAMAAEQARISNALGVLEEISAAFDCENLDVTVIKSLDHWPDLGSDLDLYTNASSKDVSMLMWRRFDAQIASRSWGDRLAGKWNFVIPGLPEAVEIHMGRLGQTGEQVGIATHLLKRTRRLMIGNQSFRVPSAPDRLMISTLQRMYRHFYFRLCDIVDTMALCETGALDYKELRCLSSSAGIWEGVATYLAIVSDYARMYGGQGIDLPQFVTSTARFGGDEVYYAREFLRVPILPQSARLYGSQLANLLRKRELQSGARLSLLPWLATAALVGQRLTGTDKGIW